MLKLLKRNGWKELRQEGSHHILEKDAVKMLNLSKAKDSKIPLYVLEIEMKFAENGEAQLQEQWEACKRPPFCVRLINDEAQVLLSRKNRRSDADNILKSCGFRKYKISQAWWCIPVILPLWEALAEGSLDDQVDPVVLHVVVVMLGDEASHAAPDRSQADARTTTPS